MSVQEKGAHLLTEKCEEIIDNKTVSIKIHNKTVSIKKHNKTVISIKENNSSDSCKPFVASSILFLLVSVILTGLFIYFYASLQSKKDLNDYY